MGRSFDDVMRDDAAGAFGSGEFMSDVIRYPAGNRDAPVTIRALIDRGYEVGDLSRVVETAGRNILRRAMLSMSTSIVVTESQDPNRADVFAFDGSEWYAERIVGVDGAMQDVSVKQMVLGYTKASR